MIHQISEHLSLSNSLAKDRFRQLPKDQPAPFGKQVMVIYPRGQIVSGQKNIRVYADYIYICIIINHVAVLVVILNLFVSLMVIFQYLLCLELGLFDSSLIRPV
jgi:hypothetical protein